MSSLPEKMSSLMTSCLSPRPILSTFIIAFISWHSSVLLSVKLPCLNRFQQIASNNLVCGFVCQLQDFQFVLDCFLLTFDGCLCCCHDFVLAGSPFLSEPFLQMINSRSLRSTDQLWMRVILSLFPPAL